MPCLHYEPPRCPGCGGTEFIHCEEVQEHRAQISFSAETGELRFAGQSTPEPTGAERIHCANPSCSVDTVIDDLAQPWPEPFAGVVTIVVDDHERPRTRAGLGDPAEPNPPSDAPAQQLLTTAELAAALRRIAVHVEAGDSFEGSLTYTCTSEPDTFAVQASYRVGNLNGQGVLVLIPAPSG
jgi:hypothetical protein